MRELAPRYTSCTSRRVAHHTARLALALSTLIAGCAASVGGEEEDIGASVDALSVGAAASSACSTSVVAGLSLQLVEEVDMRPLSSVLRASRARITY